MAWASMLTALLVAGFAQALTPLAAGGGSESVWALPGEGPPDSSWDRLETLSLIVVSIVLAFAVTYFLVVGWRWRAGRRPPSTRQPRRIVPMGLMKALQEIEASLYESTGQAEPSVQESVVAVRVPEWFARTVEAMGLPLNAVLAAIRAVRRNDIELTAYFASVILAEMIGLERESKEVFIINMSTELEDFLMETQYQQGAGQAVGRPLHVEVFLDELVEKGPEPGVAYLLDDEMVSAPGLPSAVPASLPWRNCRVYDLESASYEEIRFELGLSDWTPLLILTRAVYPSRLRRVGVERSHKGFSAFSRAAGLSYPVALLTHRSIYNALPESVRVIFRPVKVRLDLRMAVERASQYIHRASASRLAVAEALMPGLCQTLAKGGWEEVSRFLKEKGLDKRDVRLIVEALSAHLAGDAERLKTLPRSLLKSLGIRR